MSPGGFQNRNTNERQGNSRGAVWLLATLALLVMGCGAGYIAQMNNATSKGYELRALEKEVVKLRGENAKVAAALAELQSMHAVSQKVKMMGMVEVGDVEFITPPGEVAVAR